MLLGAVLVIAGIGLVLWGAERFTDGSVGFARRFRLSSFTVGAVLSGFEPENLVTGVTAAAEGLPHLALGTVVGSAIFLLTGGLGAALLLVPMDVRLPYQGIAVMLVVLAPLAIVLWDDGRVDRGEGAALVLVALALMVWLYRRAPALRKVRDDEDEPAPTFGVRAAALLFAGGLVMVAGAELVVHGSRNLLASIRLSETFLGMAVIGLGESLEETARMVAPARRGHPELAWGNVVGTMVMLLAFNLGAIAAVSPIVVDPLVLQLHVPYLIGCTLVVALALALSARLGRGMGLALIALYVVYLALNIAHVWG